MLVYIVCDHMVCVTHEQEVLERPPLFICGRTVEPLAARFRSLNVAELTNKMPSQVDH